MQQIKISKLQNSIKSNIWFASRKLYRCFLRFDRDNVRFRYSRRLIANSSLTSICPCLLTRMFAPPFRQIVPAIKVQWAPSSSSRTYAITYEYYSRQHRRNNNASK